MSTWIIEPCEPLIFRDGRPFSLNPGIRAQSLSFPFPSTTTGAVRTQSGLDERGVFVRTSEKELRELKRLQVRGPLLVQLPVNGDQQDQQPSPASAHAQNGEDGESPKKQELQLLAPAPADALLLKIDDKHAAQQEEKIELRRLIPLEIKDALTDLPTLTKSLGPSLLLTGTTRPVKTKPFSEELTPAYWTWSVFKQWLLHPDNRKLSDVNELGIPALPRESRVHISMDFEKHTSKDGMLFETIGREFATNKGGQTLHDTHQLALAVSVGDAEDGPSASEPDLEPKEGFSTLGGERRMVYWRRSNTHLPECPKELIEQIKDGEWACRVILLTPAYFERGCYPTELLKEREGVKPTLIALAVNRPQVVSGWDFTDKSNGRSQGSPKKTRRLAPTGSVLFLTLQGSKEAIEQWVKATWMHCIGDDEQLCRDGFGLAVVGTWDGKPKPMEPIEEEK